jgi:hypothetical protein
MHLCRVLRPRRHRAHQVGGNGLGGGLYAAGGTTITFQISQVVANGADGGAGAGGNGIGQGGGVYLAADATVTADTLTIMVGNHASTSDDDVFGDLIITT